MWKNQRGFSLIEVIIVIALIAVLAGSSVAMIGHIRYANTKKVAEEVDKSLSRLRLDTMSQEKRQYLYIYEMTDPGYEGYYLRLLAEDNTSIILDGSGIRLCGPNVTFDPIGVEWKAAPHNGVRYFVVAFKKNGQLDDTVMGGMESIVINGNGTYTIRLNYDTGRHYLE